MPLPVAQAKNPQKNVNQGIKPWHYVWVYFVYHCGIEPLSDNPGYIILLGNIINFGFVFHFRGCQ